MPSPQMSPFLLPLALYAERDVTRYGTISWGQLSQPLLPTPYAPTHHKVGVRGRKGLDFGQVLISNNENITALSTLFQQKSKTLTDQKHRL